MYEHDDDMDTAAEVPLPSSSKASIEEEMRKSAQAEAELDALSSQYSEWMVINDKDNSAAAPSIKKEAGDESETQDEWESEAEDAADKAEEWEMVSNGTMASSVANASVSNASAACCISLTVVSRPRWTTTAARSRQTRQLFSHLRSWPWGTMTRPSTTRTSSSSTCASRRLVSISLTVSQTLLSGHPRERS